MSDDNLENLVRPFQSGDDTPSRAFYAPGQISPPNIILRIGRGGGSGKTLNGSISISESVYMKRYENEKRDS